MNNYNEQLYIAITRPLPQGEQLQQKLKMAGFNAISQPLFEVKSNTDAEIIADYLATPQIDGFIFISTSAVKFANRAFALKKWQLQHPKTIFFAVGKKTKAALLTCGIASVLTPVQENSEGLLALPELINIENKTIIIIRGDPGREYLAEQLTDRGANIRYLSSYQKVWCELSADEVVQRWLNAQINCIVVTSIALLEKIVELLTRGQTNITQLNNYQWVVVSNRIAQRAQQMGLTHINLAENASDQAMITTITKITNRLKNDSSTMEIGRKNDN